MDVSCKSYHSEYNISVSVEVTCLARNGKISKSKIDVDPMPRSLISDLTMFKNGLSLLKKRSHALGSIMKRKAAVIQCSLKFQTCVQVGLLRCGHISKCNPGERELPKQQKEDGKINENKRKCNLGERELPKQRKEGRQINENK